MKELTKNKKLLELLGDGYIVYIPESDGNGYSIKSHNANSQIIGRIKTAIEYRPEINNEYKEILKNMLDFDYGFPAYEERAALNYAINNL